MLRSGAGHPDADLSAASTSRQRSPEEEAQHMYATLNEYLLLEHKSQPKLCLPAESENGEVTTGARDGAAHVLRCLKIWYDLPADVLISAINLFDRFLTKMKEEELVQMLEIVSCDAACVNTRTSELALVLLYYKLGELSILFID
ncbi:hypothetical protein HF086_009016 [Spodoptera exigua]|uniref:Cyclin N-terminal domain-containing protein n=1 Tax=Spodoptera exigua TaxID=7107 RepID=A0A922M8W7_SPOEX|nr:hypothetical protein HF086_009016 [Spodoptera exigua]